MTVFGKWSQLSKEYRDYTNAPISDHQVSLGPESSITSLNEGLMSFSITPTTSLNSRYLPLLLSSRKAERPFSLSPG